jgi:RND family efflux transporter MFP subunit
MMDDKNEPVAATKRGKPLVLVVIAAAVMLVLGLGAFLVQRAESKVNKIALTDAPKPVTVIAARAASFRPSRHYVGTIEPWVEAKVGPQLVSAYIDTVLVRPGAVVKRAQVLATLDCRNASATSKAISMQARAIEAQQAALSHEAGRVQGLLQGGFVSPNEAEQKNAQSAAQEAQLLATQAKLLGSTLEVNDCVLRAPFDGEIAARNVDPGAFARPDTAIVSVVDRSIVRVTADVPEVDFDFVEPGALVQIHVLSSGRDVVGRISRLAPAADPGTRTLHFEIDVPNSDRSIPVGTTAELRIDVGIPVPTSEIPLSAAAVRGDKASVFTVVDGVAHARTVHVQGERAGRLYLDTELAPATLLVTEGRALLNDGDSISAVADGAAPARTRAATSPSAGANQGG